MQDVPAYAAVRTNGRRRYEIARSGGDVPAMERAITIRRSELVAFSGETAIIRVRCSSGTYVRSIAEHIGRDAGCGAYLASLRREQIGEWHVRDALNLETLRTAHGSGNPRALQPMEQFLPFARVMLGDDAIVGVGYGKPVHLRHVRGMVGEFTAGDLIALCNSAGLTVAIAEALVASTAIAESSAAQEICRYRRVLIG
jgi:tRNA pseudouridine55 synthase